MNLCDYEYLYDERTKVYEARGLIGMFRLFRAVVPSQAHEFLFQLSIAGFVLIVGMVLYGFIDLILDGLYGSAIVMLGFLALIIHIFFFMRGKHYLRGD